MWDGVVRGMEGWKDVGWCGERNGRMERWVDKGRKAVE